MCNLNKFTDGFFLSFLFFYFFTHTIGIQLQVLTGKSLFEAMKERLFDPLGMKDTYFHLPPEKVHRFAEQYIPNPFSKADIARMEKGGTVSESGPLAGK